MINHLTSLKVPFSCCVVNHSIHDEAHKLRLITSLSDGFSFAISLRFELLKILRVKVVISVLQESVDSDCIFVQKLRKLGLQGAWKNFEEVGHLLVVFDLTFWIKVLEIIL